MSKSPLRRRFAAFALALGLAGSLALAAPAVAEDDRPSPPDLEHTELMCKLFGGTFRKFSYIHYQCIFENFEIECYFWSGGEDCLINPRFLAPPLRDECEFAGGRYGELSRTAFACELREGVLVLHCVDDHEQRTCEVGWVPARDGLASHL